MYTLQATDDDLQTTCNNNNTHCDCAVVLYDIVSGNDDNLFRLDSSTGHVRLNRDLEDMANDSSVHLRVSAVNREVEGRGGDLRGPSSYGKLVITKGRELPDEGAVDAEVLDRQRRVGVVVCVNSQLFHRILTIRRTQIFRFFKLVYHISPHPIIHTTTQPPTPPPTFPSTFPPTFHPPLHPPSSTGSDSPQHQHNLLL